MQSFQKEADAKQEVKSPPLYVFIPLELDNGDDFTFLSAFQKISILEERIKEICSILEKEKPEAEWIILWREYGVSDGLLNTEKSISSDSRQALKAMLKKQTALYPRLTVVAGSTLTYKERTILDLKAVAKHYKEEFPHIKAREEELIGDHKKQYIENENHVNNLIRKKPLDAKIKLYANKTRVVREGKIIHVHCKVAPFKEIALTDDQAYQASKPSNRSPYIQVHDQLSLITSICREYSFDIDYVKQLPKPLFGCLLSAYIVTRVSNIHSQHGLIQVDSKYGISYVLSQKYRKDIPIVPEDANF